MGCSSARPSACTWPSGASIPLAAAATCAAPAIPLAQAIGRWGNYFNQELYGRPTDLPWGLEIDADHLQQGYAVGTTFHPTFLYESLWSFGLVFVLLWIDKRFRPAPGQLFVMYIIGYGIGRFWVESLRIDPADDVLGLRLNQVVALVAVVLGVVVLAWMRKHPIPEPTVPAFGTIDGDGLGDELEISAVTDHEPDDATRARARARRLRARLRGRAEDEPDSEGEPTGR